MPFPGTLANHNWEGHISIDNLLGLARGGRGNQLQCKTSTHTHTHTHAHTYTGWPKKNATLTINNFKKTRDIMKKCALSRIKFFSQQEDTKNANFDEGVLILWPLS